MCGIAGEIRFDGRPVDAEGLARITRAMQPRGPDAEGLWIAKDVGLGHRRLSIIDLTEAGGQPMLDSTDGLALAFNGCIYNFRELRAELEQSGARFQSQSDTEVVLRAYQHWGADCVTRFNGMFAFAIWDSKTRTLTLARDRLGIKPLYLAPSTDRLRFASSLPALLQGGEIDTRLDPEALGQYLSFHAVVAPPHTVLQGVRKLKPGTVMTVGPEGETREWRYWSLPFGATPEEETLSPGEWQERVLEALRLAVRRRMVADVPVGVLLSGGVDSSLIVGLLAEEGQSGLKTFSVGFETVGTEVGDEFQWSDLIAQHYGTDHTRIRVDSAASLLKELPGCIRAMNEPMTSHDAIGFYLLSREVSQHVKVVQSGQGADEIFGGYHWYPPLMDAPAASAASAYASVFVDRSAAEIRATLAQGLAPDGDAALALIESQFAEPGADSAIDKALRLDTRIMLADDPVKRVDSMTMAWGLEARVPFLDHELVELSARVPAKLKVEGGGKTVLKEAARRVIPAAVIDRPKGYFPVPALKYLRGPVLEMVADALTGSRARSRGLFQPDAIDRLLADPDSHITKLGGSKLWQCALLELWLSEQGL